MQRNKLYEYDNQIVACLGDPHLGKKFKTGVPSHRLGEREKLVLQDFEDSLMDNRKIDIHVCMGDLFDKAMVDYQTIFAAYDAYAQASYAFPKRQYFVIMGNHDMSRNSDKYSSFQMFTNMIIRFPNIHIVMEPTFCNGLGFIPYHPFKTSDEMMDKYITKVGKEATVAVFGHWDLDTFNSEMPHNIIPVVKIAQLGEGIDIYTGHIHTSEERNYTGDLHLEVIGSMQPYSFAEDPTGQMYITMTMKDLYNADPKTLKDKCIRVMLEDGDVLPEIDCLQIIGKKVGSPDEDDDIDVEMIAFDMQSLMREELKLIGVTSEKTIGFIFSEYDRFKSEEN